MVPCIVITLISIKERFDVNILTLMSILISVNVYVGLN